MASSLFKSPFLLTSGDFSITTIPSIIINMTSRARLKAAHTSRQSNQEVTVASHSVDRLSNKTQDVKEESKIDKEKLLSLIHI